MPKLVKLQKTLAFEICMTHRISPALHKHNMHEFFFCLEGAGLQHTTNAVHRIDKGELFLFPAGVKHIGSGAPDKDCHAAVLNFGDSLFYRGIPEDNEAAEILDLICGRMRQSGYKIAITEDVSESVRFIMKALVQEVAMKKIGYQCAVKMHIQKLLLTLLRKTKLTAGSRKTFRTNASADRIAMARTLIDKHFNQQITVDFLCGKINMSRSYFHAAFLKSSGITMTQYLNRTRVNAAIEMLKSGKHSTEETAFACGFGSVSNFYRTLRLETGLSPNFLKNP